MGVCLSSWTVTAENNDTDVRAVSAKVIARLRKKNVKQGSKKPAPLDLETTVEIGKSLHYWKGRLLKTKTDQEAINKRLQEEYEKTYKKYEYEPKKINTNDVAQMKKLKAALIKCYKANQKKSLNCSKEVENFNTWFEESKIRNRVEEKKRKEEKEKMMMEEEEKKKANEAAEADYTC